MSRAEVIDRISRLQRAALVSAVIANDRIAREFGMNAVDFQTLHMLMLANQPVTPRELASRLGIPPSTLTRILDRLEQRGFIDRTHAPDDRRRVIVTLRPHALDDHVHRYQEFTTVVDDILARFSDDELDTIVRFLDASQSVFPDTDGAAGAPR